MNIVKKMAIAATILCATVANAQDIQFGARVGYSFQSADGGKLLSSESPSYKIDVNMGMLGLGVGVVANIPAGPVVISPEVSFVTRTVANVEHKYESPAMPPYREAESETWKDKISEFAINIPVMIKFFPIEGLYIGAGFQLGIPIGSEICTENDEGTECEKLDGKTETVTDTWEDPMGTHTETYERKHAERTLDLGIPIGIGYMITPNLGVDFRFVLGLNKIVKYEDEYENESGAIVKETIESGKMNTFGLGITYLF